MRKQIVKSKLSEGYETLKRLFTENGYLYISSIFSKISILDIRKEVCDVLKSEGMIEPENSIQAIPKPVAYHINSPQSHRITEKVIQRELIHTLAYDTHLLTLLENLLGKPIYPHPCKMFRICYPLAINPDYISPPHQDIYYIKGEKDTFTVWIPLGNYSPSSGALQIMPGTHRNGFCPIKEKQDKQFLRCATANIPDNDARWVSTHYKAGDCLILHSLTIHSGTKNREKALRLSIDCRFSALHGDINEEQIRPLYFTSNETWANVTKDWSGKIPIGNIPESLNVLPKETPLKRSLDKASIFT